MASVRLWFYDPASDGDGFVNKLVARMDQPFCHVKTQFGDGLACSIYMGTAVVLRKRTFDSSNYSCVTMPCTRAQHSLALAHAHLLNNQGLTFSSLQMYSCLLWTPIAVNATSTFCSKLVVDILQHASLLPPTVMSHQVTQSTLHRMVLPLACVRPAVQCRGPATAIDFKSL